MNDWQQTRQQFIKSLTTSGRYSPHTIEHYKYGTDWLLHWLVIKNAPFLKIDVEAYNEWLIASNINVNTHRQLLTVLRQFIKWLRKTGHKVQCHEDDIVLPKINRAKNIKYITLDEVEDMLELADNLRDKTIIYLLFSTGMRISELLSIRVDQVSEVNGSVLPPIEIVITGKGNKTRTVYLSKRACRLLEEWITTDKKVTKGVKLFDVSPRTVEQHIKDIGERALDKRVTPHTLRHGFATYMLSQGADLRTVQELLGHTSIETTTVYAAISNKALKDKHGEMMT